MTLLVTEAKRSQSRERISKGPMSQQTIIAKLFCPQGKEKSNYASEEKIEQKNILPGHIKNNFFF